MPKLMKLVVKDTERELVMATLEQLKTMVDEVGASVFYDKTVMEEMISIIKQVIHRRVSNCAL